jgi:hypothetical protein
VSAPVFISYSSIDQKIAETICDALQSRGYACWISCRDVRPGENFQEAIVRAIRSAKLMILVFTSNANNSDEIKKEIVLAGQHRVTVVPVRVEDVAPNDALAYEFATRQWIDLFKDWERHIEQLTLQIGNVLADGAAHPAEGAATGVKPLRPEAAKSAALRPLLMAGAAAVAIGLGGAYLYMRPTSPLPSSAVSPTSSAARPNEATRPARISDAARFDGAWMTTMSCPKTVLALGFTFEFVSQVNGASLHGQYGTEGQPASLRLDGKIEPDGGATIDAKGYSGTPAYNHGTSPPGTPYVFKIAARFDDSRGSAAVVLPAGRPCDFTFAKK